MSVLVFAGKYFDTLLEDLNLFSSFAFGLKPTESKSAVLISDLAPFRHVFFKQ